MDDLVQPERPDDGSLDEALARWAPKPATEHIGTLAWLGAPGRTGLGA